MKPVGKNVRLNKVMRTSQPSNFLEGRTERNSSEIIIPNSTDSTHKKYALWENANDNFKGFLTAVFPVESKDLREALGNIFLVYEEVDVENAKGGVAEYVEQVNGEGREFPVPSNHPGEKTVEDERRA
jgi:hypothetical protein